MTPTRRAFLAMAAAPMTAALCRAAEPTAYWVYVGTYTGGKGGSKGIYRSRLDPKTGTLTAAELAAEFPSPSFLAAAPDGKALYAVGERGTDDSGKGGAVTGYDLDPATGKLTGMATVTTMGVGPCHLSLSPDGRMLLVASYGDGTATFYLVNENRTVGAMVEHTQFSSKSHGHCTAWRKDGKRAFVCDLGTDTVWAYPVDPADRSVKTPFRIKMPPGSGPRHIAFNADQTFAYVNGERNMTVSVIALDAIGNLDAVVQTLSTVPGGKPGKGHSTAEVRTHPSGQFVYVSNRGHNSIAAYKTENRATLKLIGHATAGVKTPRNFNLDPTGKWMLVANQDGDDVAVFRVGDDGLPKPTGKTVKVGSPVCVTFVPAG